MESPFRSFISKSLDWNINTYLLLFNWSSIGCNEIILENCMAPLAPGLRGFRPSRFTTTTPPEGPFALRETPLLEAKCGHSVLNDQAWPGAPSEGVLKRGTGIPPT